jgi:hypothetical protein
MTDNHRIAKTRDLNDRLRQQGFGGRLVMSAGVAALAPAALAQVLAAVRCFAFFTPDNDPYGEHDCAVLAVGDQRFIWKIDYYDQSLTTGSPDPSDPTVTTRVLSVMLAEEY